MMSRIDMGETLTRAFTIADGAEELPLMSKEEAAGTILDRALAMAGC